MGVETNRSGIGLSAIVLCTFLQSKTTGFRICFFCHYCFRIRWWLPGRSSICHDCCLQRRNLHLGRLHHPQLRLSTNPNWFRRMDGQYQSCLQYRRSKRPRLKDGRLCWNNTGVPGPETYYKLLRQWSIQHLDIDGRCAGAVGWISREGAVQN